MAPATVYSVTGGKASLLKTLITMWTTDPIVEATLMHIGTSTDSEEIVWEVASASRRMQEAYVDVIRVVLILRPTTSLLGSRNARRRPSIERPSNQLPSA